MTIEIRPAAVRDQIAQKSALLDEISGAVNGAHGKVDWFCGSGGVLAGEGYEAARIHMGQYKNFCLKVAECVEMTREADSRVLSALGRFGGMSVVSEREWLEKRNSAQRQASRCRSEANRLAAQPFSPDAAFGAMCARFSAVMWQNQAEFASRKLSDIYSYCAETNGLYEGDFGKLTDAVRAGASAFTSCRFDSATGKWASIDYSWTNDEIEGIAAGNLNRLLFKGYGEAWQVLYIDPALDWAAGVWEENEDWIASVGQVVIGVASIVGAVAALAAGGGVVVGAAALLGFSSGMLDVSAGTAGLVKGEKVEWEEDLGRGIASVSGGDPDKAAFGVSVGTTVVSLVNIKKIPLRAGKLAESGKEVDGLSKAMKLTDSFDAVKERYEAIDLATRKMPLLKDESVKRAEFINNLCEMVDSVDGGVDISEKVLDAIKESRKEKGSGNANNAAVAAGNGF